MTILHASNYFLFSYRFIPPITTSIEQDEDVVLSFPIVDPSSECDALMQAIDHQVKGVEVNHRQVNHNHQVVRGRRGVNVVGEHQGAERHLSILSRPVASTIIVRFAGRLFGSHPWLGLWAGVPLGRTVLAS